MWRILQTCSFAMLLFACADNGNRPPTAIAGPDIVTTIRKTITVDGSGSSDVDGDKLIYTWKILERPEKSTSELSDTTTAKPDLYLDNVGRWLLQLTVRDGTTSSKPDQVSITTTNQLPSALISDVSRKAGVQFVTGDTVILDGSTSRDPDQQTLTYNWSFVAKPANSTAELISSSSSQVSFIVDRDGEYIVHLIVDDGIQQSLPEIIVIRVETPVRLTDTIPVAEAGPDQPLYEANTLVTLDGSKSSDVENDSLSYQWELLAKPAGSVATLANLNSASPSFTADILGSYVAKLVVSDRNGASHNDVVVVTPHAQPDLACQDCHNNIIARGKLATHFINYEDCSSCHTIIDWISITAIEHAHGHNAWPPSCVICHDGINAGGKSKAHLITDSDCNYCHLVSEISWLPALKTPGNVLFEHAGIASGCASCHDGITRDSKPTGHVPSSDRCNACHKTNTWLPALHLEHSDALGLCINCHELSKRFRPDTHINTSNNCTACHNENAWLPVLKVNHVEVIGSCASCHNGKTATGKKANHPPANSFCDKCHGVQNWTPQ